MCAPTYGADVLSWVFRGVLKGEHINVLEFRAYRNSLKWRTRSAAFQRQSFLHLLDSQVSASIAARGRTSSFRLQGVVRKTNALLLACQLYPVIAFVHSEDNPADVPSRFKFRTKWTKGKFAKKIIRNRGTSSQLRRWLHQASMVDVEAAGNP